jgi:hypothetical protein
MTYSVTRRTTRKYPGREEPSKKMTLSKILEIRKMGKRLILILMIYLKFPRRIRISK